jgi:polyferredoxin
VLTGLRKRGGIACIRIQSLMTLILTLIVSIVIFASADMKMLLGDMFNISFGLILMVVFAVVALIFSFEK